MQTSSFFTYKGPGRISVARYAPRFTPRGFSVVKELAPGEWFNSVSKDEYRERYFGEILGRLDPKDTYKRLVDLAGDNEPVLLCWERPPFTEDNWCHRRMIAEWFEQAIGIEVPEMPPKSKPRGKKVPADELARQGLLF